MPRKIDSETNPVRSALLVKWGRAIKAAHEARGLTKAQAAEALGVPVQTLHAWVIGRRAATLSVRRRVVELWGADPAELETNAEWCPHCGRPYEVEANSTRPKPKRKARKG